MRGDANLCLDKRGPGERKHSATPESRAACQEET
jgi:hypothetical protein